MTERERYLAQLPVGQDPDDPVFLNDWIRVRQRQVAEAIAPIATYDPVTNSVIFRPERRRMKMYRRYSATPETIDAFRALSPLVLEDALFVDTESCVYGDDQDTPEEVIAACPTVQRLTEEEFGDIVS